MSARLSDFGPPKLVAVLGPTNTGKTHLAVERMLGHASGMIGLPLRLLAREIYDRIVKLRGPSCVALITGEEKIVPARAQYFVCTVEAMPLSRQVEFLAVDEIQLCADPERGHIFTHRLLHARGRFETMFMGAGTMAPLIRRLLPEAEIVTRERFSRLTYSGPKKLTRLPRRSAVVAFSADQVYAIAELIRRQRGGAAVVMGSLSPRTRNAQVALYQSGEVDFLVATDAIGMGLNMDVDHVAFAGLRKFDGKRTRFLHPPEVGQIAGRAGRFTRDGTFGVTGECEDMDADLIEAVQEHHFEAVTAAEWRNAALDFSSLKALSHSLAAPPAQPGLKLSAEALDEKTLRALADEPEVIDRTLRDRSALTKLWDVCQTPDFRKTSGEEHIRLVREFFGWLTSRNRKVPEDWIAGQYKHLDRTDGEIDTLAARLASVRTLAYVANRPDWLADPGGWQGKTRLLEDRLSDTLHEKLMARFVDRRTSVLMRALHVRGDVLAGVAADGAVTIEGQYVGKLSGVAFEPAHGSSVIEEKALRAAATAAVAPEIAKRLGKLSAEADEAFSFSPEGVVYWRGEAAAAFAGGTAFAPRVRLYGELGPTQARERAARRLEAFLAAEAARRLAPLRKLDGAVSSGKIKGLARGVAYRLIEAGGILDRDLVRAEAKALSQVERRMLKSLGVRLGAFSLYLPALLKPASLAFAQGFVPADRRPSAGRLDGPMPTPQTLAAFGLRAVGRYAVPVETLERLDGLLRAAPKAGLLSDQAREELGWNETEAREIMRALGFAPTAKPKDGEPLVWRRRGEKPRPEVRAAPPVNSPFAALAALKDQPPPARRPRRRRKPKAARSQAS
ncbi:phosphonate-binding protein [Phenylobacterium sp. Root77]|uniref:helicase-related protein n=1 Tax=unclassified Phenylobacterium TaxID=2640670 RepID=UPI00070000CD|nr:MULTISPECIES: helicase-related protein [unclassified Phenylobacterium]KQW70673.1 phosphonate-binding protein [Phenylobacterium sp. Root1277]KQW90908.1 phosphonate-binding protein [Phenylobacterium sp. Root1290]KRC39461.1 phosphonate-binding protein [Phenylobacterium sp. Root77]